MVRATDIERLDRDELISVIKGLLRELEDYQEATGPEVNIAPAGLPSPPIEFFDKIIDTLADPVFVKDEQHRWIAVNQAFCDLMGQERAEILGKSDFDYFPQDEARTFWEKDELVFSGGGMNINEEPLTDASGATHILVTKKTVFSEPDGRKVLVGVMRDVTEQKEAEEALRAARDELEERVIERTREVEAAHARLRQAQKMEAIGQLTGGIAHDFNNLLAVILGSLELSKRRLDPSHPSRVDLANAQAAAERGSTLTHRLLAFSRRQALQPAPTDVNMLIGELMQLIRRTLGENIAVHVSEEDGLPSTLVDPVQLETALLNLAINARDAMPDGGELSIATRAVDMDAVMAAQADVPPGEYVSIRVTDTGLGMSPQVLERVFEPFFTTKGPREAASASVWSTVSSSNRAATSPSLVVSATARASTFFCRAVMRRSACARRRDTNRPRRTGSNRYPCSSSRTIRHSSPSRYLSWKVWDFASHTR